MKSLILLTALLTTSALADFEVKVNRIEASATDKINTEIEVEKEVVDGKTNRSNQEDATKQDWDGSYNSSRPNRSTGDEAGILKGQVKGQRLDTDSDDDGIEDVARKCGVDDDCDGVVNEAKANAARRAK